jgi:hypothetical protein
VGFLSGGALRSCRLSMNNPPTASVGFSLGERFKSVGRV